MIKTLVVALITATLCTACGVDEERATRTSEDFGAKLRRECESAYRQIVQITEKENEASHAASQREYQRRYASMSATEKAAEDAAYQRATAGMEPKSERSQTEERVSNEERRWVKACITNRATKR
ncbi:MAG: hypothetical protein ACRD1S_07815 [Vicinamibacterales bacterium]